MKRIQRAQKKFVLLALATVLLLGFSGSAVGQSSFGFELTYLTGFQDNQIQILDEYIDLSMPHGSQVSALYSIRVKETKWVLNSGFGGKFIQVKGETSSQLGFSANSFRLNAMLGGRYTILKDFDLGLQFAVESNRDLDEFTYAKADLWRYYVSLETSYAIKSKWNVVFKYWRSLSPNNDVYVLFSPINQLSIGLNYHFNEI